MRGIVAASCLCALALLATGCGERAEPTGSSVRIYPVSVQGASGPPTVLERAPRRILAVGRDMVTTLRALGVRRRVVAATNDDVPDRRFDIALAWASSDAATALLHRRLDVPEYIAADVSVPAVERALADLGVLVGRPLNARAAVAGIEERRQRVAERLAGRRPVTVFLDTGFFTTVSDRTIQGDIIAEAGGQNVGGAAPEAGPFDPRQLVKINPRFYLATSDSGTTLEGLRRNPRTRRLTAVRAGRFAVIPAELLEPGPHVGGGIAAIARVLHPDAFR